MYQTLDNALEKIKDRIRREFNHLGTLGFDELNVVGTKKLTQEMYDRLLKENESAYRKIAKEAYKRAKQQAEAVGYSAKEETEIGTDWIAGVLAMYNLVTGYLYNKEAERKRLRISEEILTAREFGNRQALNDSLRKSANLWYTQSMQYGIEMVDKGRMQAFKDMKVKYVRWVSVHDDRRCDDCKDRDGKIYKITEVPDKDHYGCRCYLEPIEEE